MTLRELYEMAKEYQPDTMPSLALRAQIERSIVDGIGLEGTDARFMMRIKHLAVIIWLSFTVVTGVIAIAASLQYVQLNETAFELLWTTFVASFGSVVVMLVRDQWKKRV